MKNGVHWKFIVVLQFIVIFVLVIIIIRQRQQSINANTQFEPATPISHQPESRLTRRILSNNEPLIFVGGVPRSGTTLMRVMLDAHPDIRCAGETMIIPEVLNLRRRYADEDWIPTMNLSGVTQTALDHATSAFLLEIIGEHGPIAKRLCSKDPFTALYLRNLVQMFPNAKYILMIRDARATIHSMIERNVPVLGFNHTDLESMFKAWNYYITLMLEGCSSVKELCIKVYYERLVQRPKEEAQRILRFLDVPWSEDVMNHQEKIGGKIKLNPKEFSTSQVKEKVYQKALATWYGCYSSDLHGKIDDLAPMLRELGYNTSTDQPDYAEFAKNDFYQKEHSI